MKKKSFFERIQAARRQRNEREAGGNDIPSHSPEEFVVPTESTKSIMPLDRTIQSFRVFVSTWNVGGKSPNPDIDLDSLLQAHDPADIYVLGFQEIVPLSAGNVLVNEDHEPAAKWLSLINQSLNNQLHRNSNNNNNNNEEEEEEEEAAVGSSDQWKGCPAVMSTSTSSRFFPKPSLKRLSTIFRSESRRRLKSCNCTTELERTISSDEFCFRCHESEEHDDDDDDVSDDDDEEEDGEEEDDNDNDGSPSKSPLISPPPEMKKKKKYRRKKKKYSLVEGKQMVGIFVCVWMRTELIQHVWHLRVSCVTRGLMGGYLGNKGCISVSMSFHQTSFCFICGHLASGEKEGDELRRNLDVTETLKNTHFHRICNTTTPRMPLNILGHDRIIWFGDLNYRIALNHSETGQLMEANNWEALLDKDQLKIEREAGRVFKGWKEGMIYFAPTYKYSYNSDAYARDNPKPKNRRNPAWCDRILWHGEGIRQTFYIRGESRFSDHRPVCAGFSVDVVVFETSGSKNIPTTNNMKVQAEELLPAIKIMYPKSSGQIISEIVNS